MSLRNAITRAVWSVVLMLLVGLSKMHAQSVGLPAGPVQAKVRSACTECHDSRIVLQQRLSDKAWTREVDKMIKWGAVVDPTDRDAFIHYLSLNFPPDKPLDSPERVGGRKRK
ncbi:MAG: hypothetical protein WB755_27600 [Terriglobales bacterium]|jgi:hypothetical protein